MTLSASTVSGNTATSYYGGGIYNGSSASISNSTISANTSAYYAGGIYNSSTATILNSAITGNTAGYYGGGFYNAATLTLVNDTVANNSATTSSGGGGYGGGTTTIINNTITNNTAGSTGGGVYSGSISVLNSIIAGNQASASADFYYTALSGANNQIGIPGGKTLADIFVTDANGKPVLANNGGPTQTITTSASSVALNAGTSLATLAAALDNVATTFTVTFTANNTHFIPVGVSLQIDNEIMTVTAVSGTTITVTRGQGGTTAAMHATSAPVNLAYDQTGAARTYDDLGSYVLPGTLTLSFPSKLAYAKNQAATAINSGIVLSSLRFPTLASATVKLTNFYQRDDVLGFVADSLTMGNIAGNFDTSTGILTLTSAGATATVAQFQAALRAVTYFNRSGANANVAPRYAAYQAFNGSLASNVVTSTIGIGSPPVLAGTGVITYAKNQAATPISPAITITDVDHPTLSSATIVITNSLASEDRLAFVNNDATKFGNISASYASTTGTLFLYSPGATATVAQFQFALQAVTYFNLNGGTANLATRKLTFQVSDGILVSNLATGSIAVGSAPVIAGAGTLAYALNQVATVISPALTLSDADHPTLASATVKLTNYYSKDDVLGFVANPLTMGNIAGGFSTTTGLLTLTSAGATATVAQFQAALRAITYFNRSGANANVAPRYAAYQVSNGALASNVATSAIGIGSLPVLTGAGVFAYVKNQAATAIGAALTLTDVDHPKLASATVTLTNYYSKDDVLGFVANAVTMGNITGNFDTTTGILTLTSAGTKATVAQFQAALRAVTYFNRSGANANTAARYAAYQAFDGTLASNVMVRTVTIS